MTEQQRKAQWGEIGATQVLGYKVPLNFGVKEIKAHSIFKFILYKYFVRIMIFFILGNYLRLIMIDSKL